MKTFEKAIQLAPDNAELWIELGKSLRDLKRSTEALLSFQRALTLDPRPWEAANGAGVLLHQLERIEEALSYFIRRDEIQPNQAPTLYTRGRTLMDLGRFEESLTVSRQAHALDPTVPDICDCIWSILQRMKQSEEALQWFDRALRLQPSFAAALINKAALLGELHHFGESFATYDLLKAIDPDNAEVEWNFSLLQLLTGNFEARRRGRESRWRVPSLSPY